METLDYCETFINVVRSFDVGMVGTEIGVGLARPMVVADVSQDGHVIFLSSRETVASLDFENALQCFVTFQGAQRFVSAVGGVTIDLSRGEIRRLWSEDWRPWFPQGPGAPSICLVRLAIERGHYWDAAESTGASYVFARNAEECVVQSSRAAPSRESWA